MNDSLRILITGGGTGGHTTPAVAAIQEMRAIASAAGWEPIFLYLGSRHGVEAQSAAKIDVPFFGIETGKLRRARSKLGLLSRANFRDAFRVPVGYFQALAAVRKFKPDVVLSTGGYVSVPGVLAARALGVPVVAHEQTVQVGLANKINFRTARIIALSVDETLAVLPFAQRKRAIVTGNPVRVVIFGGDAGRAAREFGFADKDASLPVVYITGGAQGSRIINKAVEECVGRLTEIARVIHQCGAQPAGQAQDLDRLTTVRAALPIERQARYAVRTFISDEIGDVYALADLIIGRSGAGTVAEVCALGKAALFIPLVPTGGDEQTRNARRLEQVGAARILKQEAAGGEALYDTISDLLACPAQLTAMGEKAATLAAPDAARKLAGIVVELGMGHRH